MGQDQFTNQSAIMLYVGAIYHPTKPICETVVLLDRIRRYDCQGRCFVLERLQQFECWRGCKENGFNRLPLSARRIEEEISVIA